MARVVLGLCCLVLSGCGEAHENVRPNIVHIQGAPSSPDIAVSIPRNSPFPNFVYVDANHDGKVDSRAAVLGGKHVSSQIDSNNDGTLDVEVSFAGRKARVAIAPVTVLMSDLK